MALHTASGPMPVMRGATPSRARAAIAPATTWGLLVRDTVRSLGCKREGVEARECVCERVGRGGG